MQSLKVEDQIQLTHVFEEAVQRFDKDLDEVKQGKWGFGGCADYNEVERCVVPICHEGRGVVVLGSCGRVGGSAGAGEKWREGKKVAGAVWTI